MASEQKQTRYVQVGIGPPFPHLRRRDGRGHGGGDDVMLADIFDANAPGDPLKRAAGIGDGAYSILVGVAANLSMKSGVSAHIADLVKNIPAPSWES